MTKRKTVCQQIVESLYDNPHDWSQTDYHLVNKIIGVCIRTSGLPVLDTQLRYCNGRLYGLKEKFLVWRAIRAHRRYFQFKQKNGTLDSY